MVPCASQPDVVVDSLSLPSCYEQLHVSSIMRLVICSPHWNAAIAGNLGEWGGTAASVVRSTFLAASC